MIRKLAGTLIGLAISITIACEFAYAQLLFEQEPIKYSQSDATDAVARLQNRIRSSSTMLRTDRKTGYLKSLLKELRIPISSQTLVFSKTSLQRHLISSKNPRAIYFNETTYVGWVPGGELIEIASMDPILGAVFYTIEQPDAKHPGVLSRNNDRCLFCHASTDTKRVPGLLMRSVLTNSSGDRVFPVDSIASRARGPMSGRWAGWFATGSHGTQQHLGNWMVESHETIKATDFNQFGNISDLSRWFEVSNYLSPHSDLVALLILQHQVSTHNLLTDCGHRSRKLLHESHGAGHQGKTPMVPLSDEDAIRLDQIAERLVDGLLMVDDITFTEPVAGSSRFAEEFVVGGPRDAEGRSLRDLDLKESTFRYPCSYLIYSDSYDSLPDPLLSIVNRRLTNVLRGRDVRSKYSHLSPERRSQVLGILIETKPGIIAP